MLEREGVPTDDRWPAPTIGDDAARGIGLYRANILPRLLGRGRGPVRAATVPVQVVVATRDRFVAPSSIESVVRSASEVSRVDVDAGHWVIRSHPDEVAAAVVAATGAPPDGVNGSLGAHRSSPRRGS
jgi:pimeloyl-ACP methyl ester carboxylesterase